ncbi:TPA: hypothetical protein U1C06_002018 [Streptococcus suis]|uniref:hypothetical protein n=1 Tax=Streptococcus suis TaxID=1307 RepID=UPI002AA2C902|nr:hypothetical protein [Streptococcus suis]HEM3604877.1 hypothetical protein [Streptococcus suis]HEM3607012.1 hypothetical protein [Streptococcus suis]
MKKMIIALLAAFCLIFSFIAWKLETYQHAKVELDSNADFYLVYPGKIEAFQLSNDQPKLIHTQKMNSDNYFGSGKNHILDNQYLVFANDQQKFTNDNLVSIDFKTGEILRKPSKYATYISGTDGQHFYTAGPFHALSQFDNTFKLKNQLKLDDNFFPLPYVYADDTFIYLNGNQITTGQSDSQKNVLYIIDKTSFTTSDIVEYDKNLVTHEGLLAKDTLYLPITSHHALDYKDIETSYDILTFNTKTRTFSSISLSQPAPESIQPLKEDNLLFIEHESDWLSAISFTIYNTQTGQESYHRLDELNPRPYYIDHVRQLDGNRLLLILAGKALIYDWQAKKVLSQTILSEDYVSGVWVND